MRHRHIRTLSFVMSLMLLLSIFFSAAGCSKTKKDNSEKLIRKCQGTVEDYLVFLTSGKFEKLDRYCDPDDDIFQMKSAVEGFQQPLWEKILEKTTFEVGDVEIDDDEAEVSVTLSLPDSRKILNEISDGITYSKVTEALENSRKTTEVEIVVPLEIKSEKNIMITSTEDLYDAVKEQYDILEAGIPDFATTLLPKVETFMSEFSDLDIEYLFLHANIPNLDDYEEDYEEYYKACMSFLTYEIEPETAFDEYTGSFIIHAHAKDFTEVASRFFTDPESLSPLVETFFYSAIRDDFDPDAAYADQLDFDALISDFSECLEASPDFDLNFRVTINVDTKNADLYTIEGSFESLLPPLNPWIYMDDLEEEEIRDLYIFALRNLYDDGRITDEEYALISMSFDDTLFDSSEYKEMFEQRGFEIQSDYGGDYLALKDDTFWFSFITAGEFPDSLYGVGMNLEEFKEEISLGKYSGTVNGGWLDFTFEGTIPSSDIFEPDSDHEHKDQCDAYIRTFCIDEFVVIIAVIDPTEEHMAEIPEILEEMGLPIR